MSEKEFGFADLFYPLTIRKMGLFILCIGFIVFFNALFNGFVWDDRTFIQFNPDVSRLDILYLLGPNMFNNVTVGQYRFLVALYFTLHHILFGETTFFYHVTQLLLHIGNTMFVFLLFKRFMRVVTAFFLALVFLVHPIQVESVAFIASAGNPLFVLCGLLALWVSAKPLNRWWQLVGIGGLLLLSLLAKETGIAFVVMVFLFRWIFFHKKVYSVLATGVFAILSYIVIRFGIAGVYFAHKSLVPIARLTLYERLVNIPAVIFYYLKTVVFPDQLAIDQLWVVTRPTFANFFLPLSVVTLCGVGIVFVGHRLKIQQAKLFPAYLFFVVWFVLGIGLYSQVFPLDMTVADRWFYFPFIGLLGMIGIMYELRTFSKRHQQLWLYGVIILICLFALRTMVRNADWTTALSLYTHDTQVADNFDLENNLGGELSFAGREAEAMHHYQRSVALFPHETNLFNLGLSYEKKGDFTTAEQYYLQAYQSPSFGEVAKPHRHNAVLYVRLGILLLQHDPMRAVRIIDTGLRDYPMDVTLWYAKAQVEYRLGHHTKAVNAAKRTVELLPNNPSTQLLYQKLQANEPIDTKVQ